MLKTWKDDIEALMEARVKIKSKQLDNARSNVKKVFKEFGIVEGTELYEAFVDLS